MTQRSSKWWDAWFLQLAKQISTASKDPSTRVGAVIVGPDKSILSVGYNGFPRGLDDDPLILADRDKKYRRTIHAEMNAILSYGGSVKGATLYVYPFQPCEVCALHVIQAGITRVVAPLPTEQQLERWGESFAATERLFEEGKVELATYASDELNLALAMCA